MRFRYLLWSTLLGFSSVAVAAENQRLDISIYNNNLALVKDTRKISVEKGRNDIAFEGVAVRLKPESVMIEGDKIRVLEQNYNYNLITPENIVEKSVGKSIKTVRQNPQTGENIFERAKVLSVEAGVPVLEFSYGIETAFSGRLVFEDIPTGLQSKPTLAAKIYSTDAGFKELSLAYLTSGISWQTDYVAHINDANGLDLNGWVTINNQSGIDYPSANVQLIAGEVKQLSAPRRAFAKGVMLTAAVSADSMTETDAATPQQISGYQLYTLPEETDLQDNQTKQVNLFEKNNVTYKKEGHLQSALYFSGNNKAEFEKNHPQLYYVLHNTEEDGLGIALPAGVMRFYENDGQGRLQFIGEDRISHVAKGENIKLHMGSLFNVFANGRIARVQKVSEDKLQMQNNCTRYKVVRDYEAEVTLTNGGSTDETIIFKQPMNNNMQILKTNFQGEAENISTYRWRLQLPADRSLTLNYVVRTTEEERRCD